MIYDSDKKTYKKDEVAELVGVNLKERERGLVYEKERDDRGGGGLLRLRISHSLEGDRKTTHQQQQQKKSQSPPIKDIRFEKGLVVLFSSLFFSLSSYTYLLF